MSVQTAPELPTTDSSSNAVVRFFLSHKAEDAAAAGKIREHLVFLGKERLHVFVKESKGVPFGSEYRPKTLQELAQADKLILLYTDPDQEWDVCLYESGFYDGKLYPDSTKRLIVLHDESIKPPEPLAFFHAVPVSQEQRDPLRQFIHEVYAVEPRPGLAAINPELMHEKFAQYRDQLETAIITAVCGPQKIQTFAKEIRIEIPEESLRTCQEFEVPKDAKVYGDRDSFGVFGLRESTDGYEWREFYAGMDHASDHTGDWIGSLANLMKEIAFSPKRLPSTGLPLYRFHDRDRTEVFRPAIRSFRRKKGVLSFKILFTDLPRETTAEPIGPSTTLARTLTAARMIRWGVLQRLHESVEELNQKRASESLTQEKWSDLVAKDIHQFFGQKLTVLVESFNRGYERRDLLTHFDSDRRARLEAILTEWDLLCEGAKELADKFQRRLGEPDEIEHMTTTSLRLNKELMVTCAERYLEALREM